MSADEDRATVAKLVGSAKIALVTTVTAEGKLVSRPLAMQDRDFDGELWFFTQDPSHKTEQVQGNDQVNVALQVDDGWVSLSGTASVSHDQAKIDEFWDSRSAAWFEQGREDPAVALLKVEADSAEYWAVTSPKVVVMVKYAKAMVTGERPDIGTNASVEL